MIAKWIANAMLRGDKHLILSTEELAEWQRNGCRVSLGAPFGLLGSYMERQIWQWSQELHNLLLDTAPESWPVGELTLSACGNKRTVCMPALEFHLLENGQWQVPLIPSDENHWLNAWAFDLYLSPEELAALEPIAQQLTKRCQSRCEIKSAENVTLGSPDWNQGRLALARLGGLDFESPAYKKEIVRATLARRYRRDILSGRRLIAKDPKYAHEMQIICGGLGDNSFDVKFFSSLLSSWPACEGLTKLEVRLSRDELINLKRMINESLGLEDVPLPSDLYSAAEHSHKAGRPIDIAREVSKFHDWLSIGHSADRDQ